MLKELGQAIIIFLQVLGRVSSLSVQVFRYLIKGLFRWRNVFDQMVRVGYDSVPITIVSVGFVGMVFSVQIASQFTQYGAGRMVGAVLAIALARELAPLITAIVIAGRVGASYAAEIGTMKVTEQIDALYTLGSDPYRYLFLPRYLACFIMVPFLTLIGNFAGFLGGYLVAVYVANIDSQGFMSSAQRYLKVGDVTGGLLKTAIFGLIIASVGCYYGLYTEGGARGVGQATTRAVVVAMLTIFVANYFLSLFLF